MEGGKILTLECFISNVYLLHAHALQYRFHVEYYLFRKTFSCSRAIRNFETIGKAVLLGLVRMVFLRLRNRSAVLVSPCCCTYLVRLLRGWGPRGGQDSCIWRSNTCAVLVAFKVSRAGSVLHLQ